MMGRAWLSPAVLVSLVLLGASAVGFPVVLNKLQLHLEKEEIYPASGLKLVSVPREFGRWEATGSDKQLSKEIVDELGTSNYVSRWYQRTDLDADTESPRGFELHLSYYTGEIDTVPHVPERCFVGGGMVQDGGTRNNVKVPYRIESPAVIENTQVDRELMGGPVYAARSQQTFTRVNLPLGVEDLQMSITPFQSSDGQRLWAGYFFIANGVAVASADQVRLQSFKLSDDYAYYTKVQFMSADVESAEELAGLAAEVLGDLFPEIMRALPDWVEVKEGRYP